MIRDQDLPARLDGKQGRPILYLAGPDVFLPDPLGQAAAKRAVLDRLGIEGQFPLDNQITPDMLGRHGGSMALAIAEANEQLMHKSDGVIANMTPYHGKVSMDVGTAFEIGFMRALGKPVFGYSNDPRPFAERVTTEYYGGNTGTKPTPFGEQRIGSDGLAIEDFGQEPENLMMPGAIAFSGGSFVAAAMAPAPKGPAGGPASNDSHAYLSDLEAFTQVARKAAEFYYGPEAVARMEQAATPAKAAPQPRSGGWTAALVSPEAPAQTPAAEAPAPAAKREIKGPRHP